MFLAVSEDQQIPTPQVNNLTFLHPTTPLLLGGGAGETVCSAEAPPQGRGCREDFCECLHLYRIPLGATVDLVLIDEGECIRFPCARMRQYCHSFTSWLVVCCESLYCESELVLSLFHRFNLVDKSSVVHLSCARVNQHPHSLTTFPDTQRCCPCY